MELTFTEGRVLEKERVKCGGRHLKHLESSRGNGAAQTLERGELSL